jgi:hypothetical protein
MFFPHGCSHSDYACLLYADVWTAGAKEGLTLYLRDRPVYFAPPQDLPERMIDYVLHVLGVLSLLVMAPGTTIVCPHEF